MFAKEVRETQGREVHFFKNPQEMLLLQGFSLVC